MHMYGVDCTVQHQDYLGIYLGAGSWGSRGLRGAVKRPLLSGQSCWPITGCSCFGGLSGRRPTSTSGLCIATQSSSASRTGPELHDLPLLPFSGILIAPRSCFSSLLDLPGKPPATPICDCNTDQLFWF